MNARIRSAAEFLGLRRGVAGLLGMCVLVGMGEKMAERFLPIYILALGGGTYAVGALNGLDNLLSALYSYPGGWLSDRLGVKRALLVFNLTAIFGFLVVILIPRWEAVLAGAVFFLSWTAISLPATMDLIAKALPPAKRTMGVSVHSLVRRIPMALGPIAGGFCIRVWGEREGVRIAFGVAVVLALAAVAIQQIFIEDDRPAAPPPSSGESPWSLLRNSPRALRSLLVSDILIRFCEQIPYAFVAVWCMKTIEGPVRAEQFGYLTAIEMVTAMLVYIPVARLGEGARKKPFVLVTFVNFTVFPLVLWASRSFWPLALAFVVRGLKEFGEPTRKALILELAPEGLKAATFGAYYLARDLVVSIAAFGGAYLWSLGPETNFIVASACGLAGTIFFALFGRDEEPETSGPGENPGRGLTGAAGKPMLNAVTIGTDGPSPLRAPEDGKHVDRERRPEFDLGDGPPRRASSGLSRAGTASSGS